MLKNIQNQLLFLTLSFCFLVPLTHGMQGTFDDEEKSSDASDDYTISNPLVLIVGIQEYPYCDYDDLSGVERDMTISYHLFVNKCDYVVKSTYHDGPSKVGKVVRKSDLDNFLHEQYNHLYEKRDIYDALIFLFSALGGAE